MSLVKSLKYNIQPQLKFRRSYKKISAYLENSRVAAGVKVTGLIVAGLECKVIAGVKVAGLIVAGSECEVINVEVKVAGLFVCSRVG